MYTLQAGGVVLLVGGLGHFVRASRGQRSFLLGCRDVPQYKVMKYLVFGVISSSLLPHMTTRIRMRMQSVT